MEYSVFKKIQAFHPYNQQSKNFTRSFSAFPCRDYVNPGIGAIKLYSNYVPIYGQPYTTVVKKIDEPHELKNDLEGEGEQLDEENSNSSSTNISENERQNILDNLNHAVKNKLPETVYKNILHPGGIRTGKLLINEKIEPNESRKRPISKDATFEKHDLAKKTKPKVDVMRHKFQFV